MVRGSIEKYWSRVLSGVITDALWIPQRDLLVVAIQGGTATKGNVKVLNIDGDTIYGIHIPVTVW